MANGDPRKLLLFSSGGRCDIILRDFPWTLLSMDWRKRAPILLTGVGGLLLNGLAVPTKKTFAGKRL